MPPAVEMVTQWRFQECPFVEECSEKAWKRAYCCSQTSEQHARKLLWYHCSASALHENQSRENVYVAAQDWPIVTETVPKWKNPDERFEGCSLEIVPPDDEEGNDVCLEELRQAKRKFGEDEPERVRTRCPFHPESPTGCRARPEPPFPSPLTHSPTHPFQASALAHVRDGHAVSQTCPVSCCGSGLREREGYGSGL